MEYLYGIFDMSWWGYVLISLIMVQITNMGVTLYLHRDQSHRSLDLHPALRHFFRLWLWLTSGTVTRQWVAVHRKHHAMCETEEDPHSPKVLGLGRVLLEGAELYQEAAAIEDNLAKYGRGTPDDWLERKVYGKLDGIGIVFFVILALVLFGVPGIIMIAVQMVSQPLFAAGVINGLGHHTGYRNFETDDTATNLVPWGVLIAGEELHNNHHAFPSSAKFSIHPWEFDIGWMYIRILETLGLARVNKVAPKPVVLEQPATVDVETLRAVIINRMHVLRDYTRHVTMPVFKLEMAGANGDALLRKARKLFIRQPSLLDDSAKARLGELLNRHDTLKTVHDFREQLRTLWDGAHVSNDRLVSQLKDWCLKAEASGIRVLEDFAQTLQGYAMEPTPAAR